MRGGFLRVNSTLNRPADGQLLDLRLPPERLFEGVELARRRPHLQFGVADRLHANAQLTQALADLKAANGAVAASIERFGQAQESAEDDNGVLGFLVEILVALVIALGRRPAVIAGGEGDDVDFFRLEAAKVAVLDQVVRVAVMAPEADVVADVVEERGVLQPLTLAIAEAVNRLGLIEQRQGESGHALRVFGFPAAPLAQLDDRAPADVGVLVDADDFPPVALDVVEHQAFAQRQIAQRDFLGAELAQQGVEQHGSRDHDVGPARIECGKTKPFVEVHLDGGLAETPHALRADAKIADLSGFRSAVQSGGDRAEREDRARGADHAIEPLVHDVLDVTVHLLGDELRHLAQVASAERIGRREAFGQADDAELETPCKFDLVSASEGDLDAAAADVDDDGRFGRIDPVHRRHVNEARLFGPGDDPGTNAGPPFDRLEKGPAVFGFPRRAGRRRQNLVDLVGLGEALELRERQQGRAHRLARHLAPVQAAGAQADHFLLAIDDLERKVRSDLDHNHVDRIGPDIDSRESH